MTDDIGDRYLLARFPSGGVIVNLETGNYFRVDAKAAEVCRALVECAAPGAEASEVAARLGVPRAHAVRMLDEARAALDVPAARGEVQGSYPFLPAGDGYALWHRDRPVLVVEGDGHAQRVRPPDDARSLGADQLERYLRAVAPKLLFLHGLTVLHASACLVEGRLIAFSGTSRAGKTTTARSFAEAGARLVAEDLLVMARDAEDPLVALQGEPAVDAWARAAARELSSGGTAVSSAELAGASALPHARLDSILYLDGERRAGTDFVADRLDPADGLLALMENDFLGAIARREWQRFFRVAETIAAQTHLYRTAAPLGTDGLVAAARRYISSWTS